MMTEEFYLYKNGALVFTQKSFLPETGAFSSNAKAPIQLRYNELA